MRDPTWFAAFERSLAEGATDDEAVKDADQRVRDYFDDVLEHRRHSNGGQTSPSRT